MLRGIFKRKDKAPPPELLEQIRRKYDAFRQLLADNQAVLEIVTDLEEKYNGDFLFDISTCGPASSPWPNGSSA